MQSFANVFFPKTTWAVVALLSLTISLFAQQGPPRGGGFPGGGPGGASTGRFYGKVVDEAGKGVGYAAVQLYGQIPDPVTKALKDTLLSGQITEDNGDFSLENLPTRGEFKLKISFLGYADSELTVKFEGRNFDKDLGNLVLSVNAQTLDEVVVRGEATTVTLALDKKVFRVDKNAMAAGGTAQDALRGVPSLSVDLDGNLTLRNAAPQVFVDGRPTTLTIDQIPADAIESIEVITNPSAKYDASGGQAGIVNIVLKKDRRLGYNGSVRLGADTRGGVNAGADVNVREGKINVFASGNFNRRINKGESETFRQNLFGNPLTNVLQTSNNKTQGFFANTRAGIDWFMDNRNTLTFAGSYTRGQFKPEDRLLIHTDSLLNGGISSSDAWRISDSQRDFRNAGGSILYKHLFPKEGKEWTADVNYNRVRFENGGNFNTTYVGANRESRELQESLGSNQFITFQTDYVEPITKNIKLEAGARAEIRHNENSNASFYFDPLTNSYVRVNNFADEYQFDDAVFAAYGTFTHQFENWGYMLGLRAESSQYTGKLPESSAVFKNDYPLSLFPSIFVTRKLNEQDNIQLSYTRRINRPNFFQLMPFTDFSDSLNLRRGNPSLLPEFTNSLEASYQNIFEKGDNVMITVYYKQASDLITNYQFTEFNQDLNRNVIMSTFANSNSSEAYGVEFTVRNTLLKDLELTSNVNLYNSKVDASNIESGLVNEQFTWFVKENLNVKLPAQFTLQVSGEYRSKAAFTPASGSSGHRFGGHGGGGGNTAQGYSLANWFVDVALRKDLFDRKATLTLSVQDIFRTRKMGSYTESALFIQDSWRIRDPQVARLNFSYRFGKADSSMFKRKNTNINNSGNDMMQ